MAIERPTIAPGSVQAEILTYSGYIFTVLFAIELTIKVLAMGLIFGHGTFLRSSWNVLDAILVVSSLVHMICSLIPNVTASSIIGVLRVARILRVLRPLRVINRAKGLRLTMESLMGSFKGIGNVLLICGVFYMIFGILGVQLFKGTMYYCDGPETSNVTNKIDCLMVEHNEWINAKYNYDHLGNVSNVNESC